MGRAGKGKVKRFEIKDGRSGENNADTTPDAATAALQGNRKKGKKRKREKGEEKVRKDGDFQQNNRKEPYNLPGQKHAQPMERDPLRIFYETLYRHQPDSELAAMWMMEWGLLSEEEAKKVYEKMVMKNQQQKVKSLVKAVALAKSSEVSIRHKKKAQ